MGIISFLTITTKRLMQRNLCIEYLRVNTITLVIRCGMVATFQVTIATNPINIAIIALQNVHQFITFKNIGDRPFEQQQLAS